MVFYLSSFLCSSFDKSVLIISSLSTSSSPKSAPVPPTTITDPRLLLTDPRRAESPDGRPIAETTDDLRLIFSSKYTVLYCVVTHVISFKQFSQVRRNTLVTDLSQLTRVSHDVEDVTTMTQGLSKKLSSKSLLFCIFFSFDAICQ